MAAQKTGLGRGLDACSIPIPPDGRCAGDQRRRADGQRSGDRQQRAQPRKRLTSIRWANWRGFIRCQALCSRLIVKKKNNRYMIIAGERRFRAARLAGLSEVPVLVADYDEAQIHEVSLIENIQRENLNPIEEAAAIRFLMKQHDMTQEEVSARLGKSRPAIANSLRLLQLPESVVELLKSGALSAGHGRALAGLTDSTLIEKLAQECVEKEYSVRALEEKLKMLAEKKPDKKAKKEKPTRSADLTRLEESFREALGTRVSLAGNNSRGKIVIEYYSREDLERVYDRMTGRE